MFTGLVEEVGTVVRVEPRGDGRATTVRAAAVLEGLAIGDSVSIDGACHTVTAIHEDAFEVQSIATTLARTTLGDFAVGRRVNLERAVALGQRLGGHLVQGHVDGVGTVTAVERRGEHDLIDLSMPSIVADVTILHGSITVDGVSLTVNALPAPDTVQVSIIPHTRGATTLGDFAPGRRVNLEGDLIGKYVRQLLDRPAAEGGSTETATLRRGRGY